MTTPSVDWDRVAQLYKHPDQWENVHGDDLLNLTRYGCLAYGRSMDQSQIPPLQELYHCLVQETTVEQRYRLFSLLDDLVGEGYGSVYAFMPVIYAEPIVSLISSACLSFAQLHPLQNDDPLTGPRTVRDMAAAAREPLDLPYIFELGMCRDDFDRPLPPASARKVGMLQGLLLLGDRRVLPLIDHCWRDLHDAEQSALTRAWSGFVYVSVIDFFLSWLAEASDYILGAVATALWKMPSAQFPRVIDLERYFPPSGPTRGKAGVHLEEWTFPEYLPRIEPRLPILQGREDGQRMYNEIVKAWKEAR